MLKSETGNLPCLIDLKLNNTSDFCKAGVLVMSVMVELTVGSVYFSWRDEGCRGPYWHDFTLILWATPGWHTNDREMTQIPLYVHAPATEPSTSERSGVAVQERACPPFAQVFILSFLVVALPSSCSPVTSFNSQVCLHWVVDVAFVWWNCCFDLKVHPISPSIRSNTLSEEEEEEESQRIVIGPYSIKFCAYLRWFCLPVLLVCGTSASEGISLDQSSQKQKHFKVRDSELGREIW